jgi:hypothetical protein
VIGAYISECDLQQFHCSTLRRCLGVSKGTASLSVLAECGKYPLQIHWLTRTVKYWNKLVTMQANSTLLTEALCDNLHLGLVLDAACWSKELLQGLMFIESSQDWRAQMLRKQRMDPTRITQLSQEKFIAKLSDYRHDPTNPECTTRKHCVYSEWMVGDAVEQRARLWP